MFVSSCSKSSIKSPRGKKKENNQKMVSILQKELER